MLSIKKPSYLLLTLLAVLSTHAYSEPSKSDKNLQSEDMNQQPFIDLDTAFIKVEMLAGDQLKEVESDYVPSKDRDTNRREMKSKFTASPNTNVVMSESKTDDELLNTNTTVSKTLKPAPVSKTLKPAPSRYTQSVYAPSSAGMVDQVGASTTSPYTSFVHSDGLPKSLSIIVSTRFTHSDTVGGAMAKILNLIGYSLIAKGMSTDPEATQILYQRLPKIHFNMDNISVIDALTTIAGPSYTVVFDHRIRRTTLDVSPQRRILNQAQRLNARLQ